MPYSTKEKRQAYEKKHRERLSERGRKYRQNNPDKVKTYHANELVHPQRLERTMLSNAKKRSKEWGLECTIDLSDCAIPEYCPLLGIKLKQSITNNHKLTIDSPTIDRIDNTKGYVKGNVWVISHRANTIKSDASPDELEHLAIVIRKKLTEG